ncbi:MAG: hypothetical protein AB8F94_10540, partial [Saprospiraceae bacterium]
MSLYNSPKEHKLRKPRVGFDKIKQQQWNELNSPKEEIEMKPLIELGEPAKLRIKKKRQRLLLIQLLVFTLILIPLTFVAVNFFYTKVETAHQKLAPHHYQPIPPPTNKELNWYWKNGYTALANKDYEKAISHFDDLIRRSAETTFGLTGLISLYHERCKNGHNSSCDLL